MKVDNITGEVRKFIADKLANGDYVKAEWITHEVVASHHDIEGEDTDFYRHCAYKEIRRIVRRCIGKYDTNKQPDAQLVLDGFSYLQAGYTVEREGERVLIPTDQLSNEDLQHRAIEFDKMAIGCEFHAEEIRAYIRARKNVAND